MLTTLATANTDTTSWPDMLTTLLLMLPFTHYQAVRIVQRPNKRRPL